MKVSVVMPSHNYAQYLSRAIECVLSQSYSNLELIITDDCSSDGSRAIVEDWKRSDDRVKTVFHTENRGVSAARNSGLAVSSGELIAFCDADDNWMTDKLKIQMECLRRRPESGLVHSDCLIIDSTGNLTGQRFSLLHQRSGQATSGSLFSELCQRNFLCISTVILRRECVQYAKRFEEGFRSLEDWVYWTRVSRKYPFYYVDDPLAEYRVHAASLSQDTNGISLARVKAYSLLLQEFEDIPSQIKSRMTYALGMSYAEIGDSRRAARAFVNSLRYDAFQVRAWPRLAQAFCKRS